jgi:hypothetical protein
MQPVLVIFIMGFYKVINANVHLSGFYKHIGMKLPAAANTTVYSTSLTVLSFMLLCSISAGGVLSGGSASSDLRDLIDRGLMAVAQNTFQEAYDYFSKGYALDQSNTMVRAVNMFLHCCPHIIFLNYRVSSFYTNFLLL